VVHADGHEIIFKHTHGADPARCRRGSISFGVRQIALLTRTQPNSSGRSGVPTKMAERA
jgi:hypothetical protein